MPLGLSVLDNAPRLLLTVPLRPVQGFRFQPTGFPDLGAATFVGFDADGEAVDCLLLESAQSMANRLENVCWNEAEGKLVDPLAGLPYVQSTLPDGTVTDSIREAHRLNSPYIVNSAEFKRIETEIGFEANKPFDRRKLAAALFKFDPCSLLHGIFLEKVGGVVRLPRVISGFIEANKIQVAAVGGVKVDRVQPGTRDNTPYGKAAEGYGNVPYHRDEYTAESIKAYFNVDLAQLRGYGLGKAAEQLLIAISLFKIRTFLECGLRLRTACDLDAAGDIRLSPTDFKLPDLKTLDAELPKLINSASSSFASPPITEVRYRRDAKTGKSKRATDDEMGGE